MSERKEQPLILSLETSTEICSVCLSLGKEVLAYEQSEEKNAHSKMLSLLIDEIFHKSEDWKMKDLDGIAVSKGPGSYTGLRIGVSSAKGLAYGLDIPLISVDTLLILACHSQKKYPNNLYMPMIDARRMEVYTAIYDNDFKIIKDISADIVEEDLYKGYFKDKKNIIVVGNGAEKCREVLNDKRYVFDNDIKLSAQDMVDFAVDKYNRKEKEDVAYFQPYYLKEFIAAKPHIKGLYE